MKNLQNMFTRLNNHGGSAQQDRMIEDKKRTLQRAVKNSYQGAQVALVNSIEEKIVPALMNPNKVLADYDEKTISVGYEHGFKTGEVFRWINPSKENGDTYWLIYLQDLTELAYFKADVRKCSYSIKWMADDGSIKEYFVAIKGPTEQGLKSISKGHFNMDIPNYSLSLLIQKNDDTISYFKRYSKFYLQDLNSHDTPVCWQVEATDSLSLPGILEVYAKEYYINNDEDDTVNGIVGGLITPVISNEQINTENEEIVGDNFIKPGFVYSYEYIGNNNADWQYDKNLPIKATINDKKIDIVWEGTYTQSFILSYGSNIKTIIVESLF